jgi:hypothetical protein
VQQERRNSTVFWGLSKCLNEGCVSRIGRLDPVVDLEPGDWSSTIWFTLKTVWLATYDNDLENHMVEVDDVIVKWCFKRKVRVPPCGTLTLHVEFHSKNKFQKLVHLVGFIIRNLTRCTVTWTSKYIEGVNEAIRSSLSGTFWCK